MGRSNTPSYGGVLGPNGLIFFVPNGADNIGILDPTFPSFTTLDISQVSSGTGGKYGGGVLGPNGLIYLVPGDANNIGILDPSSSSFTTLDISQVISSGVLRFSKALYSRNTLMHAGISDKFYIRDKRCPKNDSMMHDEGLRHEGVLL